MKRSLFITLSLILLVGISSCKSSKKDDPRSGENLIKSFTVKVGDENVKAEITHGAIGKEGLIKIVLPVGSEAKQSPVVEISEKATISPASKAEVDLLTEGLKYTVTAENTTTKIYNVDAKIALRTEAKISSFSFKEEAFKDVVAKIEENATENTISMNFPVGTTSKDIEALVPVLEISGGAKIDPEVSLAQNFNNPFVYTLTSEDGKTITKYTVSAKINLRGEAKISKFSFKEEAFKNVVVKIEETTEGNTISMMFPMGTQADAIKSLTPTIEMSEGAKIDPSNAQNFNNGFTYTVTSEDGKVTNKYTVVPSIEELYKGVIGTWNLHISENDHIAKTNATVNNAAVKEEIEANINEGAIYLSAGILGGDPSQSIRLALAGLFALADITFHNDNTFEAMVDTESLGLGRSSNEVRNALREFKTRTGTSKPILVTGTYTGTNDILSILEIKNVDLGDVLKLIQSMDPTFDPSMINEMLKGISIPEMKITSVNADSFSAQLNLTSFYNTEEAIAKTIKNGKIPNIDAKDVVVTSVIVDVSTNKKAASAR